jgi:formyltetrahydrofolate synthetase
MGRNNKMSIEKLDIKYEWTGAIREFAYKINEIIGNMESKEVCTNCIENKAENTKSKIEEAREYKVFMLKLINDYRCYSKKDINIITDLEFNQIIDLYEFAYKELEEKYNKLLETNK